MRREYPCSLFSLFLWLMFVSAGWTQKGGYIWQLGAQMPSPPTGTRDRSAKWKRVRPGWFDADGHSTAAGLGTHSIQLARCD
jgi:hypothetical protein